MTDFISLILGTLTGFEQFRFCLQSNLAPKLDIPFALWIVLVFISN